MSQTTYVPDRRFERTLAQLQRHYRLPSKAAVIRRAVALLSIVSEFEDAQHTVTACGRHGAIKIALD